MKDGIRLESNTQSQNVQLHFLWPIDIKPKEASQFVHEWITKIKSIAAYAKWAILIKR